MPFSYYRRLSPLQKRIYDESDRIGAIALNRPELHRERVLALAAALETGNRAPMCVKVGDDVLYGKYSGTEIDLSGKKYTVIRETDVLGVIER